MEILFRLIEKLIDILNLIIFYKVYVSIFYLKIRFLNITPINLNIIIKNHNLYNNNDHLM